MLSPIFTKMELKPRCKNFLNVWANICAILVYLSRIHQARGQFCGTVDVTLDLIQGGNEAAKGQWPFMVALYQVNHFNYICAGSLISKKHVLTAAHCIQRKYSDVILSPDDLVALLGVHNITATERNGTEKVNVAEIYVHPEWDPYTPIFDADVAILVLDRSIIFTKYIRPICMPSDSTVIDSATIDLTGTIVGWGLSKDTNLNEVPRQASIKALNDSFCYKVDSGMATFASNRTFCGGVGEGVPEQGDSGGGFYVLSEDTWVQYGIVSGIRANGTGHVIVDSFSIYTNVRAFQKWIVDTVRQTGGRVREALIGVTVSAACYYDITNTMYGCLLDDLDIKKENAMARQLSIGFTEGKNYTDVKLLTFESRSMISFPIGLGSYFPNVTDIQIDPNFSMSLITRVSLQFFENLENLSLFSRQLGLIDEDSFWDLPNLKSFALNNTSLKTIDERVFERSRNLLKMFLQSNEFLESLPRNLLQHNLKLEMIFFNTNSLKTIDEDMFQFNSNLGLLSLSNNRLESIPGNLFRNNSQLQVVDIGHNFLQTLHEKTFTQNPQLTTVILSFNRLEFLPWNIFDHNLLLVYVDLKENFLKTINEKLFERNSDLKFLDLSSNRLDLLPRHLFRNNSQLDVIDLNYNSIETIDEQTFETNMGIRQVSVVGNKIEHLPRNLFRNNLNLVNIFFGENLLHTIDENVFKTNVALELVDLQLNKLESLPEKLFRNNLLLETIALGSNSLKTIHENLFESNLYLKTALLSYNDLKILPEHLFQNNVFLTGVDLSHNSFVKIPEQFFQTTTKLRAVDLSSNKLDSLHVNLFKDNFELEKVSFSNNSIVEIDQQIFETNTQLNFVDLSSNKIEEISKNLFANNLRLKLIIFDNNLLSRIDVDFTRLEEVEEIRFYNNSCVDAIYHHRRGKLTDFQRMLSSNCSAKNNQ